MDDRYAALARDLADALILFARDRRDDDKKQIAALQHRLCQLRREEWAAKVQEGGSEVSPH